MLLSRVSQSAGWGEDTGPTPHRSVLDRLEPERDKLRKTVAELAQTNSDACGKIMVLEDELKKRRAEVVEQEARIVRLEGMTCQPWAEERIKELQEQLVKMTERFEAERRLAVSHWDRLQDALKEIERKTLSLKKSGELHAEAEAAVSTLSKESNHWRASYDAEHLVIEKIRQALSKL